MKVEFKEPNRVVLDEKIFEIPEVDTHSFVKYSSYIIIDKHIYILCDFPRHHKNQNRNILKFDFNGNLIWQVEEINGGVDQERPFTHIEYSDGILTGYNWIGYNFSIDLDTGKTKRSSFGRPW